MIIIEKNEVISLSATKHEQIIQYIESLPVGTKVSVRQVAKDMDVVKVPRIVRLKPRKISVW